MKAPVRVAVTGAAGQIRAFTTSKLQGHYPP